MSTTYRRLRGRHCGSTAAAQPTQEGGLKDATAAHSKSRAGARTLTSPQSARRSHHDDGHHGAGRGGPTQRDVCPDSPEKLRARLAGGLSHVEAPGEEHVYGHEDDPLAVDGAQVFP